MAVPAWFNDYVYMKNKLAQMQAVDSTYTKSKLDKAFNDAGFSGTEGHYKHFVAYGNSENVSPNDYFDVEYYFTSKAAQFFNVNINDVTTAQIDLMKEAFDRAGLSAWDHYVKFGMAEGIDPSASFSTSKYFEDKLTEMQKTDPSYSMEQLIEAFKTANLNPVQHYFSYGKAEGLVPEPASSEGSAQNLTYAADNLVGESIVSFDSDTGAITINDKIDDTFNGEVGTLQSEDKIDGLGGNDLLYARVDVDDVAAGSIEPTVTNVETVLFRSQIGEGNSAQTKAPVSAVIDADRISLADGENLTIGSDNSRANLAIEDVRHYSNETTVRFADADPAVDFKLYFDPQHLKADDAATSGSLQIKLMDVQSADDTDDVSPLATSPYNGFKILYNGSTEVNFQFRAEDQSLYKGNSANYDTLLTAVQHAIADVEAADSTLAGIFTASKGAAFTSTSVVDSVSYTGNGYIILVESNTGSMTAAGFLLENGSAPSSNRYVAEESASSTGDCPLIETKVELDNVGRVQWDDAYPDCLPNDIIKGSNAGDLQIGSMSMRSGIERMDLTVDRGSWLSGLYSTNNTLRMVTVAADDINDDTIKGNVGNQRSQDAKMADDTVNGQLYIGAWDKGKLDDEGNGTSNLTWADPAKLLSAHYNDGSEDAIAGLHDVAVFDAASSGYTGDINIAAEITKDSYDKYLKSVDGVKGLDKLAPVGGYENAFTYATGSGDDVVNMTVDGDIAADVDFAMNIDTGAGNDLVAFQYSSDITTEQSVDNKYMQKVHINTQDGDDTVWFYGGKIGLVDHTNHLEQYAAETPGDGWTQVLDADGKPMTDPTDDTKILWERDITYSAYEPVSHGGAVEVNAGAGADKVYVNQIDLMTGGAGSGVTWGPNAYNAVFVFNAVSTGVGVTGLSGATLNNNIQTGTATLTPTVTAGATALNVTVNFKGFTATAKVATYASDTKDFSVTAEEINAAVISAVNKDAVLNGLLVAKDGAGHSLIIESLINGEMALTDLSLAFSITTATGSTTVGMKDANSKEGWYDTHWGTHAETVDEEGKPTPFTGVDFAVESQAVVNGGEGNDLIVLGVNGEQDGYGSITVAFEGVDIENPKEENEISVTVDGTKYTATYTNAAWEDFVDEGGNTLTDATGLSCEPSTDVKVETDASTGVTTSTLTFTKDDTTAEDVEISKASATIGAGAKTDIKPEEQQTATAVTITGTDVAADADKQILVKVDGKSYTSTYDGNEGKWGVFTPATADPLKIEAEQDGTTCTIAVSGYTDASTIKADSDILGAEFTVGDPTTTTTTEVNFGDLTTAEVGDELTVTIDGTTYTATCTAAGDPATWSDFLDADEKALNGEDGRPNGVLADGVLTLTSTSTYSVDSAASYLGDPDPVDSDDIQDVEAENFYENNGRDIIELHASFGDDAVVDFETGVDQINVQAVLGSDSPVESASATGLTDKNVFVGTVTTGPKAASGIYTQTEVTDLYTNKEITFTGTKGTALVFLDDGAKDADNNVYTVAQVTASGATVMGSLTLANGESIAAADLVGVSQLVDDPDLATA